MRTSTLLALTTLTLTVGAATPLFARQDAMPMPMPTEPTKEHQWLQRFVGEWTARSEIVMAEGMEPMVCESSESVRAIGDIWIVSELKAQMPDGGPAMTAIMTLGYDPEKEQFVGSWIDSVHPHFWSYTGSLDSTGQILTLEAEGPDMMNPGATVMFRDVTEFKGPDKRVLTSSVQGPDGKWTTFMTATYTRKK